MASNRQEMIVLYGVNEYSGDTDFLATFDTVDLAEEYVINSLIEIIERGDDEFENKYKFKDNSLLADYRNYEIHPMNQPHNPKI